MPAAIESAEQVASKYAKKLTKKLGREPSAAELAKYVAKKDKKAAKRKASDAASASDSEAASTPSTSPVKQQSSKRVRPTTATTTTTPLKKEVAAVTAAATTDIVAAAAAGADGEPDLNSLSAAELRRKFEINIKGNSSNCPDPVANWDCYPGKIKRVFDSLGYTAPTAIQMQAWPVAMKAMDAVAIAKTGSGKTCGFTLPALLHIRERRQTRQWGDAPLVLVVAPTRELACQIEAEANKFCVPCGVRVQCVYGGVPRGDQIRACRQGMDICIATPGRLLDFEGFQQISLKQVSYLVLDEADRMLDMGFEPDIRKIMTLVPVSQRQTLLFSATWPKEIRALAAEFLKPDTIEVHIGNTSSALVANKNIKQYVQIVGNEDKEQELNKLLAKLASDADGYALKETPKTIIFTRTKRQCDVTARALRETRVPAKAIHGDMEQWQRTQTLKAFRAGTVRILVATDVAARGLDVDDILYVINFDFPGQLEDYIHRIGRTGRAGKSGTAYTFFNLKDDGKHAVKLVQIMRAAGQEISEDLQAVAATRTRGRGGGRGGGRRWGGGGRGGGRGWGGGGRGGGRGWGGGGRGGGRGWRR